MLYAIGRRNLVHPSLGRVHPAFGTPVVAISLMAVLTAAAAMFGDAILVPITEVGSLAVGVGWLSACVAYLLRRTRDGRLDESPIMAWLGAIVSIAIVLMKISCRRSPAALHAPSGSRSSPGRPRASRSGWLGGGPGQLTIGEFTIYKARETAMHCND